MEQSNIWRKCSVCKKPISLKAKYYLCSVSTCTGPRTNYVFCSVACFEVHLPAARHRDAGAIEKTAPAVADESIQTSQSEQGPKRVLAQTSGNASASSSTKPGSSLPNNAIPRETLVVVSKVKDYIRARSEMNTSDAVMSILSDIVRDVCDAAIESARNDGRKTVLDRDLKRERR